MMPGCRTFLVLLPNVAVTHLHSVMILASAFLRQKGDGNHRHLSDRDIQETRSRSRQQQGDACSPRRHAADPSGINHSKYIKTRGGSPIKRRSLQRLCVKDSSSSASSTADDDESISDMAEKRIKVNHDGKNQPSSHQPNGKRVGDSKKKSFTLSSKEDRSLAMATFEKEHNFPNKNHTASRSFHHKKRKRLSQLRMTGDGNRDFDEGDVTHTILNKVAKESNLRSHQSRRDCKSRERSHDVKGGDSIRPVVDSLSVAECPVVKYRTTPVRNKNVGAAKGLKDKNGTVQNKSQVLETPKSKTDLSQKKKKRNSVYRYVLSSSSEEDKGVDARKKRNPEAVRTPWSTDCEVDSPPASFRHPTSSNCKSRKQQSIFEFSSNDENETPLNCSDKK